MGGATEKTGQTGFLITSYQRFKDSERAITSAAEAVRVSPHVVPPGSLQAKQLHHLHAQLSLGRAATGKKILAPVRAGSLQ